MNKNTLSIALAIYMAAFTQSALAQSAPMAMKTKPSQSGGMMSMEMTTGMFKGVEVNGGTASIYKKEGRFHLKVSSDFTIPNSPAPHFQVVDSKGNVYLLNRLTIVGDKTQRDIVLPKYIKDVSKVQIWCSFAEVNLGEATFGKAVKIN